MKLIENNLQNPPLPWRGDKGEGETFRPIRFTPTLTLPHLRGREIVWIFIVCPQHLHQRDK